MCKTYNKSSVSYGEFDSNRELHVQTFQFMVGNNLKFS